MTAAAWLMCAAADSELVLSGDITAAVEEKSPLPLRRCCRC